MALYLIEKPTEVVVELADLKAHLNQVDDDDDDLIEALERAATEHLDGRDGRLRRALMPQTWELRLDCFPCGRFIRIPLPPLIEVESIKYIDGDEAEQTLSASLYHVTGVGAYRGQVQLKANESWPVLAQDYPEPVRVTFRAGYVELDTDTPAVPEPIKQAIKLTVGHLYANRENVVIGQTAVVLPMAAEYLIERYIVY